MDFVDNNSSSGSESESEDPNWDSVASLISPSALKALEDLGIVGATASDLRENKLKLEAEPKHQSGIMSNAEFKKQEYWDNRFVSEESYDWLATYDKVKSFILPYLRSTDRILIVGCGNSSFSLDLYQDGFENIINIDYSKNVVDAMASKTVHSAPNMIWKHMDMLDLKFEDSEFDVVIDKAAMDAIMVDEGDIWHPNNDCILSAHEMCAGISRVLKPLGKYLQISFAQPHFRSKYLIGERIMNAEIDPYSTSAGYAEPYNWSLESKAINIEAGCLNSFLYVMTKQ